MVLAPPQMSFTDAHTPEVQRKFCFDNALYVQHSAHVCMMGACVCVCSIECITTA